MIKSRRLRWAGHAARMEGKSAFKILTSKHIRMDIKEIGINTSNWVDSAQDRDYWGVLVIPPLNLQVP